MRALFIPIIVCALLTGCAARQEAYFIDSEFGQVTREAWKQQVAYPDGRYVGKIPQGVEGITAEEIMNVHNQGFAEKPEKVETFRFGIRSN